MGPREFDSRTLGLMSRSDAKWWIMARRGRSAFACEHEELMAVAPIDVTDPIDYECLATDFHQEFRVTEIGYAECSLTSWLYMFLGSDLWFAWERQVRGVTPGVWMSINQKDAVAFSVGEDEDATGAR